MFPFLSLGGFSRVQLVLVSLQECKCISKCCPRLVYHSWLILISQAARTFPSDALETLVSDAIICLSLTNSQTPLHLACLRGNLAMVSLLLKSGADIETRNQVSS
jgi:hypothetical protein